MAKQTEFLEKYFYFGMSLLIAVVVVYGFSHTVDKNLLHPAVARPFLLYIHTAIFCGWVIFFIVQTALVRIRNVQLHRRIGWFGAALGVAIPFMGISTAITMARFKITQLHSPSTPVESDLLAPFFDMIAFTVPFSLAMVWRKRMDYHRRLILIASCALTSAAFGRFPIMPSDFFYAGVDALIFLGVIRDLIVDRRIHPIYLYGLPTLILGQVVVMVISTHELQIWLQLARTILG